MDRAAERHRLARIRDQVEDDLLELVRAREDERVRGVVRVDELDALVRVRAPDEVDRGAHDVLDLHQVPFLGVLAGEVEQCANDLLDLEAGLADQLESLPRTRPLLRLLEEELGQAENREQWVVDLVRDAGGELPDRGELPALHELLVELPALGEVGDDAEQQPVGESVRRHFDDERTPVLAPVHARDHRARREADAGIALAVPPRERRRHADDLVEVVADQVEERLVRRQHPTVALPADEEGDRQRVEQLDELVPVETVRGGGQGLRGPHASSVSPPECLGTLPRNGDPA